jgi:uncharacterized protein YrrD
MVDSSLLDNLRPGADVMSSDKKELGKLHAIVIDPRDNRVTHIVVNTGPHFPEPGFGAPNLVTVPVDEMADAREEKVILKCTKRKFSQMPPYVERRYTSSPPSKSDRPPHEGATHLLWEVGIALAAALAGPTRIGIPAESFRKAEFERQILHDAPVWRLEPHSHIGDVERVLVNEETDQIAALVIRRGVLFHHDVILPIDYVTEVLDGFIHVLVSDEELERLEVFHAPPESQ